LVEHATENRSVGGSIPPLGTIYHIDIAIVLKPLSALDAAVSLAKVICGLAADSSADEHAAGMLTAGEVLRLSNHHEAPDQKGDRTRSSHRPTAKRGVGTPWGRDCRETARAPIRDHVLGLIGEESLRVWGV
jgi:hypothetical protein